ncbi:MAG: hypothetical protein LBB76_04310 [Azoarcus sp.]|jgi:hypothetical protein|nr:hypothetical protein [Azoarcus sp.]
MNIMRPGGFSVILVGALLTSPEAVALSCDSAPAKLSVQALANATQESNALTCTLAAGDAAIHLGGSLVSSLDRARGFVVLRFFNGNGAQLAVKQYGPWLGAYSSLAFEEAIAVPANAARVEIRAQAVSTRADAKGEWRIAGPTVSQGVAVVKKAGETVITTAQNARWSFSTVPTKEGTFHMQLLTPEGTLHGEKSVSTTGDTTIDFGKLPVGHYTASVKFTPTSGLASGWKSTLAVLPNDEPLNERRFGMDTGVSWKYGAKEESQIEPFLEMMRQAGVGTMRDRMNWIDEKDCQVTKWGWVLSGGVRYGFVAETSADKNMEVVQVFAGSPACAGEKSMPINYDAVYDFGRNYAANLGKAVPNIEYWNEQQAVEYFKGYPFQYANGLKAFHAGIKSVDPAINVLIGSASGRPGRFFEETYFNGTAAFFDMRNQHYYNKDVDGGQFVPGNYLDNFFDTLVKDLEHAHGLDSKPGWLTERGYALHPEDRGADGGWRDAELAQAEFLVRTYAGGFAAGYERVFFFIGGEFVESEYHTWGIVREDFSTKPAYVALAVLTRHLAGAEVAASECHGACDTSPGRTVYFQKEDGNLLAITWGGGGTALNSAGKIQDIFGRSLTLAEAKDRVKPLLLSEIKSGVPANARQVILPTPKVSGPPSFLLTGSLWIDGKEYTSPRDSTNDIEVSVTEGSTVEIVARPHSSGTWSTAAAGNLQGECSAGPGFIAQASSARIVNGELICSFKTWQLVERSHVTLRAAARGHSDVVRVALKPDAATVIPTLPASPLLANGQCPKWVPYSGNIDPLLIEESPATGTASCPVVNIKSTTKANSTNTWVFPYASIPVGTLAGVAGLRVRVADIPGVNPMPTPLIIQLYESSGEVWLLDENLLRGNDGVHSGLFDFAEQASWAVKGNGALDPGEVNRILVGWAHTNSKPGDQHAYSIESVELLAVGATPPAVTPPNTDADMALRDAIYLYHQPISGIASKIKTLAGYNCDVFQMLLDVESGYTDVALQESAAASTAKMTYRDRIHASAPMFSYTLYASVPVKTFTLGRFLDNAATDDIGAATVFGYCFSTRSDAKVLFHDGTGVCHLSGGRASACAGVPNDDRW